MLATTCSHADEKVHVAYNFNCLIENEGLLKVTGSHVYTVIVVISFKQRERDTLLRLLQLTCYVTDTVYRIARMTFKVIHYTWQALSNAFFHIAVQKLTNFQLALSIARSLCDS